MTIIQAQQTLTYDDVLIKPKYSTVEHRGEVSLFTQISKGFRFDHPIIPANMKTVIGHDLIKVLYKTNGLSILHRFSPIEEQIKIVSSLIKEFGNDILNNIGVSVGVKEQDFKLVHVWAEIGIKIICIDIAHLDSILGLQMVKYISKNYPQLLLIAGNVATGEAANRAWEAGADIVKVGIGSGSTCTTRRNTGVGVPSISSLVECIDAKRESFKKLKRELFLIADGGIREPGDAAKALIFADFIMVGNMFAGTDEAPGELIEFQKKKFKVYEGSSTYKENYIEGIKAMVNYTGPAQQIINRLTDGIRSSLSYQGVYNLSDFKKVAELIKISHAGLLESKPHSVVKIPDIFTTLGL